MKDGEGQKIFFGVKYAVNEAVDWLAAFNGAGNLGDEETRELELRIMFRGAFAELDERFGGLLGGHETEIAEFAAPDGIGIVKRDDIVDEIGAVGGEEFVSLLVLAGIKLGDEAVVVFGRRGELEAVEGAIESGADELIPIAGIGIGSGRVGKDFGEMGAAILIPQKPGKLRIDKERNVFGFFDGVEIGHDGNSDPIVSGYTVITRKYDAGFARVATAKLQRRGGANVGEINGSVPCAAKRAVNAIRFFEKNGDIGARHGCERGEREQEEACGEFEYGAHEFEPFSNTTI